ncbi:MAG: hypothetical protein V4563_15850 [Pseudomonadota bacterium]
MTHYRPTQDQLKMMHELHTRTMEKISTLRRDASSLRYAAAQALKAGDHADAIALADAAGHMEDIADGKID